MIDWSSDVCSSDLVAVGAARISGDQNVVARFQRFLRHGQPAFGLERDVLLRVRRRLAVLADIGAQKAPVAGVARPLEVVLVAAVLADRCRRRVHQPPVLALELAAQGYNHEARRAGKEWGMQSYSGRACIDA